MKLVLSSLLLVSACALSSWRVSSGKFVVTQSPDASVMEWEAASITCCWTDDFQRVTVNWLKNQTNIKSEAVGSKTGCQGSLQKDQCKCSSLTFAKITREDCGTYVCRVSVEIPIYSVVEGNGTVLTVIARERTGDVADAGSSMVITVPAEDSDTDDTFKTTSGAAEQRDTLLHLLRCLPILALILTFYYLYNTVQSQTPASPGNNQTSVQRTEQQNEEEEGSETERERLEGEEKKDY